MLLKGSVKYILMWIAPSSPMRQNHHQQETNSSENVYVCIILKILVLAAVDRGTAALSMNETHTGPIQGKDDQ